MAEHKPTPVEGTQNSIEERLDEALQAVERNERYDGEDAMRQLRAILLENPEEPNARLCIAAFEFVPYSGGFKNAFEVISRSISAGAAGWVRRRLAAVMLRDCESRLKGQRWEGRRGTLQRLQVSYLVWPLEIVLPVLRLFWKVQLMEAAVAASESYVHSDTRELLTFSQQVQREHQDWILDLPPLAAEQVQAATSAEAAAAQLANEKVRKEQNEIEARKRWLARYGPLARALLAAGALVQVFVPSWRNGLLWLAYNFVVLLLWDFGDTIGKLAGAAFVASLASWGLYEIVDALRHWGS